jgi:hypothetical protein
MTIINAARIMNKLARTPAGKKAIDKIKDTFKPPASGKIAKKVENKARKDSAEASKKLRDAERKKLKESLSENKSSEATPKRSYKQGFSKPKRSYKQGFSKGGEVGYSKGGIVDRQYLKGR